MNTWSKVFLMSVLSMSLFGCQQAAHNEDPQAVLDKAWQRLVDKNVEYESGTIALDGSGSIDMEGSEASIDGELTVTFDGRDPENGTSAVSADIDAEGSFEGMTGKISLEGEIRQMKDKIYLLLKDLKVESDDQQTASMANLMAGLYKNQWISMPNDGSTALNTAATLDIAKQKEIAEVAKKHNFFEVAEDLGNNKYSIRMNPEKMKAYLTEVAQVSADAEILEEDLMAIDELFQTSDYTLEVQIGPEYEIQWAEGNFVISEPDSGESLTLTFEGNVGKKNSDGVIDLKLTGASPGSLHLDFTAQHDFSDVTIEVPEDAQEFDPLKMMGLGGDMADPDMDKMDGMEDFDLPIE